MFSLIITVISIALVAALALATLYYGGAAFGKGAARAEASKVVLQGQQLLGAADLYFTANRQWPASINDLVQGNYLKQVPNAGVSGLSEALAAQAWDMVPGQPTFFIPTAATEVCAEVNLTASLRKRGVLKQAYTSLVAQCYGDNALTTVFRKAVDSPFPDGTPVATDPTPPADPTDPDWEVPPGEDPTPSNPGGGTPTTPDEPPLPPYTGNTGEFSIGALTVDRQFIDLGEHVRNSGIQGDSVTFTNTGGGPLTLTSFSQSAAVLAWGAPDDEGWLDGYPAVLSSNGTFAIDFYEPDCSYSGGVTTIAAGSSCTMYVEMVTSKVGSFQSAIPVQSSAGSVTITVRGRVINPVPKNSLAIFVQDWHDSYNDYEMWFQPVTSCGAPEAAGSVACIAQFSTPEHMLDGWNYHSYRDRDTDYGIDPATGATSGSVTTERAAFTLNDGTRIYTVTTPEYVWQTMTARTYYLWEGVYPSPLPYTWQCSDLRDDAASKGFSAYAVSQINCSSIMVEANGDLTVYAQYSSASPGWMQKPGQCFWGACTYVWDQPSPYRGAPFALAWDPQDSATSGVPTWSVQSGWPTTTRNDGFPWCSAYGVSVDENQCNAL